MDIVWMGALLALWDVVGQCRRAGSLDSDIVPESVTPNDIPDLLRRAPSIRLIVFNGGGAEAWFRRCFGKRLREEPFVGIRRVRLPSTSPAHAARTPARKLALWRRALREIVAAAPHGSGRGATPLRDSGTDPEWRNRES